MLTDFKWDIPVNATGAQAIPTLRLTLRQAEIKNGKKIAGVYSFAINKAAAADLSLIEDSYNAAFSFDIEGELIMALNVPETTPHYLLRKITAGGQMFTNKRFAEKLLLHLGHNRMQRDSAGRITFTMNFREEKSEGEIRYFNIIREK